MKTILIFVWLATMQMGCNRHKSSSTARGGSASPAEAPSGLNTPATERQASEKVGANRPNQDTELGDGRKEEDGGSTGPPAGGQGTPSEQ